MKRLNRKKKLIVATAITLIVIILAIVITTDIISNNSQIASEGYFATTANANSKLVASYIRKGITIGGITGTLEVLDTSDANATPEDISWGKTGYVNGVKVTGTRIDTVAQAKETQQVFLENKTLRDDYGNNVKVPAGFKISADSATSVTGGVVIEDVSAPGKTSDTKGSQFVWIPVGEVIDENGDKITITLGRYTFDSNGTKTLVQSAENWSDTSSSVAIETKYLELATSSYQNATAKSLKSFITKALSSRGYYIGRYEAGDAKATTARTGSINVSNPNNPITCKSGVYPYNYVNQVDASNLARNMYNSDDFDSDLVNSYTWDTAIVFIQTFSGDTNYSKQKGKNTKSELQKCGESILNASYVDSKDDAQDVRCNIYDMAGNTFEWNTETYNDVSGPCVYRGGRYDYTECTDYRYIFTPNYSINNISFRPILYL